MINHDSIKVSDKIFGFATPAQKEFNKLIREAAINTTIMYDESMIYTIATDFSDKSEYDYFNNLKTIFENSGGNFYFIELCASLNERLKRNITPNRLEKKKSKQDIEWSNNNLIKGETKYKLNSDIDEYWFPNHLKINNEKLTPENVADIIIQKFDLHREEKEKSNNKMY